MSKQFFDFTGRILRNKFDFKKVAMAGGIVLAGQFMQKDCFLDEKQEKVLQKLYGWGYGNFGQLGIGNEQTKHIPQEILQLDDDLIQQIAAKKSASALVTKEGKVYTWGKNKGKLLGIESATMNIGIPTIVQSIFNEKIVQLSIGPLHMLAVTEDGRVYSWGNSEHGKLGHSFENKERVPSKHHYQTRNYLNQGQNIKLVEGIPEGSKIVQAVCGAQHSLLMTDKGEVYTFGFNNKGVLGYETQNVDNCQPQKVDFFNGQEVVRISAGVDFSMAQTKDGKLFAWGNNYYGQLGNGSTFASTVPQQLFFRGEKIKNFSCGDYYAAAVSNSGKIYAWGYGNDGQLCQKSREDVYFPQQIQFNHSVSQLSCGSGHVAVITDSKSENGSLFMFGRGREGQLGIGDTISSEATYRTEPKKVVFFNNQKVTQVKAGGEHTLAVTEEKQ